MHQLEWFFANEIIFGHVLDCWWWVSSGIAQTPHELVGATRLIVTRIAERELPCSSEFFIHTS